MQQIQEFFFLLREDFVQRMRFLFRFSGFCVEG